MYVTLKNLRADGFLYRVGDIIEGGSKTIDYEKLIVTGFIKQIKSPTRKTPAATEPAVQDPAPVAKTPSKSQNNNKEKEV